MASITYWHRLEPRPRAPSMNGPLEARIRDPLWLLTRQWQFGELRGEDAGSPAFARVAGTNVPITGFRAGVGAVTPLPGDTPLEAVIEREALTPDLSLQAELSQTFEDLLAAQPGLTAQQIGDVLGELRTKLPLATPPADDVDARRFHLIAAGRAFDGAGLYQTSRADPPGLPAGVVLDPAVLPAVRAAQAAFAASVQQVLGDVGPSDPAAWQPERLDYAASLLAPAGDGQALELVATTAPDGAFEWDAFSLASAPLATRDLDRRQATAKPWSIVPTQVRFRGMPNARWWDFESGTTDFGDIRADRRDLARLVVMDFMLVHGNDWFVIPYDMPVGSLGRIDRLVVRDVFGGDTLVDRADQQPADAGARWSLFGVTAPSAPAGVGDFLLLPPSAAAVAQASMPREEVLFLRDDLANLAWGIELTVEGGAGTPRSGHERSVAAAPGPAPGPTALAYRIQTDVPANWIPFVPVTLDAARGRIALERAGIPDPGGGGLIAPVGRVLEPSARAGQRYQILEEEVTRAGTRIVRAFYRARWSDGSTHLWIARRRSAGTGEGSSGLMFDTTRGG